MTNHAWAFSIWQSLADLGLARLLVLNDFTALVPADLVQVGGGSPVAQRAIGLIGPGTGLGVSRLVPCGEHYTALEGEGGHVTLAARDAREAALIATLTERLPHVSAERVLSGPGLVSLYQAHAPLESRPCEPLTAAEISARGLAGSFPLCAVVLDSFCAMLATARDQTLAQMALAWVLGHPGMSSVLIGASRLA